MSDQHLVLKLPQAAGCDDLKGKTGQSAIVAPVFRMERKRDQSRAAFDDPDSELTGQLVTERSGAHFGNLHAPRRYNQPGNQEFDFFLLWTFFVWTINPPSCLTPSTRVVDKQPDIHAPAFSSSSMATISRAERSQKSCPGAFSWYGMSCFSTKATKSGGV